MTRDADPSVPDGIGRELYVLKFDDLAGKCLLLARDMALVADDGMESILEKLKTYQLRTSVLLQVSRERDRAVHDRNRVVKGGDLPGYGAFFLFVCSFLPCAPDYCSGYCRATSMKSATLLFAWAPPPSILFPRTLSLWTCVFFSLPLSFLSFSFPSSSIIPF